MVKVNQGRKKEEEIWIRRLLETEAVLKFLSLWESSCKEANEDTLSLFLFPTAYLRKYMTKVYPAGWKIPHLWDLLQTKTLAACGPWKDSNGFKSAPLELRKFSTLCFSVDMSLKKILLWFTGEGH